MLIDAIKKTIAISFAELREMGYPADILTIKVYKDGSVYYSTPPITTDLRAKRPWSFKATEPQKKEPFKALPIGEYEVKTLWESKHGNR